MSLSSDFYDWCYEHHWDFRNDGPYPYNQKYENTKSLTSEYIEFSIEEIQIETKKAVLIKLKQNRPIWLPKSQIIINGDKVKIKNWLVLTKFLKI